MRPAIKSQEAEAGTIRGIITKDRKNNDKHLVTDMPNGDQMVFAFSAFLLVKATNSRIFECVDIRPSVFDSPD